MIKINVLFDSRTCECFHILQCLREIVKSDFVIAILANSDSTNQPIARLRFSYL